MLRLMLATLLTTIGATAQAGVLDRSAAGFTVENTVVVPADPKTAWKALVDDVDRWWPKDHSWWGKDGRFSIEPRAGGCFCEHAGKRSALHMTVAFVDPGRLLRMVGGQGPLQGMGLHGALEWRLAPAEGGTRISLHYVAGGYTSQDLAAFAEIVDRVQGVQLGALAGFIEQRALRRK